MKNPPQVKVGDEVDVHIWGKVTYVGDLGFEVDGHFVKSKHGAVISVEALPPPVEVFRDGTVRSKVSHRHLYTLTPNGYFDHVNGTLHPWDQPVPKDNFTSEFYERGTWTVEGSA